MPTTDETAAAYKIAAWNVAHGSILQRLDSVLGGLVAAIDAVERSVSDETVAELQAAARSFAVVAHDGLRGPWSGAAGFDEPRREALQMQLRGAQKLTDFDPRVPTSDAIDGAILITRGTEINGVAREYAQQLVELHS